MRGHHLPQRRNTLRAVCARALLCVVVVLSAGGGVEPLPHQVQDGPARLLGSPPAPAVVHAGPQLGQHPWAGTALHALPLPYRRPTTLLSPGAGHHTRPAHRTSFWRPLPLYVDTADEPDGMRRA